MAKNKFMNTKRLREDTMRNIDRRKFDEAYDEIKWNSKKKGEKIREAKRS